ncbi:unnamed protein product, partial [Prorocentrum cordatum]
MSRRGGQQQARFQNAASGADSVEKNFDAVSVTESWRTWRVGHPIRAGAPSAWKHQWQGGALPEYSAASGAAGGPLTHMRCANVHGIWASAPARPMVIASQKYKADKERDPAEFDQFGRAVKYHQSIFDLILSASARVEMLIGCSVNDAAKRVSGRTSGLLGLWWRPAPRKKLSRGQGDVARSVFFDLVEAAHRVPDMCAAEYDALSGVSAASGASAASVRPLPLARPPLLLLQLLRLLLLRQLLRHSRRLLLRRLLRQPA